MHFFKTASFLAITVSLLFMVACPAASILRPDFSGALRRSEEMLKLTEFGYTGVCTANSVRPTMGNTICVSLYRCMIGPRTNISVVIGSPAKVAFWLISQGQAWDPWKGTSTR